MVGGPNFKLKYTSFIRKLYLLVAVYFFSPQRIEKSDQLQWEIIVDAGANLNRNNNKSARPISVLLVAGKFYFGPDQRANVFSYNFLEQSAIVTFDNNRTSYSPKSVLFVPFYL